MRLRHRPLMKQPVRRRVPGERGAGGRRRLALAAALLLGNGGVASAQDPDFLCSAGSAEGIALTWGASAPERIAATCAPGDAIFVTAAEAALLCDLSKPTIVAASPFNANDTVICSYRGKPRALKPIAGD